MPDSTYRVQLTPSFRFRDAAAVADYLAALGVSHLYASPYLQAAPGSNHGYDVVDHHRVNDELGGEEGHAELCEALAAAGLGQVLDIVPNHMAIGTAANRWWWDVLKHGPDSRYARYFDVDWDPPESKLRNKVLLPVLGDHYGRVLDAGELVVEQRDGEHVVRYHEHVFPLTGEPRDDLDAWLEEQHYRLAYWRTAGRELDYRRFFDITTLIGLRVEDAEVFADTHRRIIEWVHDGVVDGLRVDHPDGLRDPEGYLHLLHGATDGAWIVVEKILEHGERLPPTWPVAGTTGYDFLNLVGGLFVDPAGEQPLTELYAELTGEKTDWAEVAVEKKLLVLREVLAADVIRLAHLFVQVCERHRRYRDYTRHELTDVLREVVASFPVYRTYVQPREGVTSDEDRRHVEAAIGGAVARRPDLDSHLVDFLRRLLVGEVPDEYELVERFQQLTGPVMAKGVEDTAFYTFNRLVCLNEVGGDPGRFGTSVEEFHRWCAEAGGGGLLATSTHDTKRSEDVRARIAVLSTVPEEWAAFARRWLREGPVDANAQYLLLQSFVGAWPISVERAVAYAEKATKEAKAHTSWIEPDPDYDTAVRALVEGWLGDEAFVADVGRFVDRIRGFGEVSSLAQVLLLLTAPGVPDIYQGSELWDLSLVDPDNRRPVDYGERRRLLADLSPEKAPKLFVIATALRAGVSGDYRPLPSDDDTVAFVRGGRHVVAVPRFGGAPSFELPPGDWHDLLPGLPVSLYKRATSRSEEESRSPERDSSSRTAGRGPAVGEFRVWAPRPGRVDVEVDDRRVPMERDDGGWWATSVDDAGPGTRYAFVLDGGEPRADPRSPWQPEGVFGPSALVDHDAFAWTDEGWGGFDLASAVLYELHVGTFTPAGRFDGVIERLDHLVDLGVTAVEVMPVAEFPGTRGWGYDGVNLYAPHHAYGGPDGFKRLVDACHGRGLGVVLDVVYNHLGPAGNHVAEFGPYFTDRFATPWGDAVNFAEHEVRRFVVDNACMWLRDYHVDALRLDAVHAVFDDSPTHVLQEMAAEVPPGTYLIAEHETLEPRLTRDYGLDAQWHDAYHHAIHAALTGERDGYYALFGEVADIAATARAGDPPHKQVVFAQNHDQVGNRAVGERLGHLVPEEQARAAAALVLLSPFVPLLFQGEEWGASTPFQYFTDHADPELARAVSEGRRSEFGAFGWKPEDVPDPQDPATFERSRLDWAELDREPHAGMLRWYRELISLRRRGLRCDVRSEG